MSQRRGVVSKVLKPEAKDTKAEELSPFTQSLADPAVPRNGAAEAAETSSETAATSSLSMEERYENERMTYKVKKWKESAFAVGLTEPTWADEYQHNSCYQGDMSHDNTGCICFSAAVCSAIGAGRVGNISVLKQSTEWAEKEQEDEETGEMKTLRFTRPRLDCVMGPYWPMLCFVTYPLILGVSGATAVVVVTGKNPLLMIGWFFCTVSLIAALACTAFRDPGVLYRHESPPPQSESVWRWSDTALTYRPRGAIYDPDTAVVVEEFDHTCPWTGTAIGKRNMACFQAFVSLVFLCLILDILILTRALA